MKSKKLEIDADSICDITDPDERLLKILRIYVEWRMGNLSKKAERNFVSLLAYVTIDTWEQLHEAQALVRSDDASVS